MKAFKPKEFFSLPLNRLNCVYGYEISGLKKPHYLSFSIINVLLGRIEYKSRQLMHFASSERCLWKRKDLNLDFQWSQGSKSLGREKDFLY